MSMQENNIFILRENRFTNPTLSQKKFSCIQIKKNFKSINLPDHLFTNFSKSMGSEKYKLVREIWNLYKNHSDIVGQCMMADEIINEKKKIERLKKIIAQNTGEEISEREIINNVFKFKHKKDVEIQFYFYYDGKVLNLILIDLFHLGITAKKNGKEMGTIKYIRNKDNKCCLSNITKF